MAKKLTPKEDMIRVDGMWQIEREKLQSGYLGIIGVDEAGRGPLAGPVYAAAVVLPEGIYIPGINDSKKLSEKKREELFDIICEKAVAYHISSVSEDVIDEINILNATYAAMNDAIEHIKSHGDFALIDGNRIPTGITVPCKTVVKGDSKSISIAAASILAKVARDRYIIQQDTLYPEYGFSKHKGYGTKQHTDAIAEFGPCKIHRRTFIKNFIK